MIWLWAKAKSWLAGLGVALAVLAGAFLYGRRDGVADAKADEARANATAAKDARKVEDDVRKSGDADVDGRLAKWMRDAER